MMATKQMAFARIMESIWEEDFVSISFGFRPNRGCHRALAQLDNVLMKQLVGYVIDADIEGYFDNVDHGKIVECLKQRISDEKFLRYIVRMLKSGIMEGRNYYATEKGTPQGGVASPILANIYLHYLLDLWFVRDILPNCRGQAQMIRYCDDFVRREWCQEGVGSGKLFYRGEWRSGVKGVGSGKLFYRNTTYVLIQVIFLFFFIGPGRGSRHHDNLP